ncbi:MAG TPA: SRPBCC family protein [Casimicrobiaceae bacterium]|jgi:ribosome-associated toxin RatA of RatAB toxin-antitoxin module|nr:SRPBCC family protein [Casimicrobiaceae bacterium]
MPIRSPLLALVSALALVANDARGDGSSPVDVRVDRVGGALVISASVRIAAEPATAWSVLTDYAHYREFVPGVRASRVVARRGSTVLVEQSDELALWLLRVPIRVTYEIDEYPPLRIRSRALAPTFPPLESTFRVDGSGADVRLHYEGHVGAGMPILDRVEQRALEQAAIRGFEALAAEIERRSAAGSGK